MDDIVKENEFSMLMQRAPTGHLITVDPAWVFSLELYLPFSGSPFFAVAAFPMIGKSGRRLYSVYIIQEKPLNLQLSVTPLLSHKSSFNPLKQTESLISLKRYHYAQPFLEAICTSAMLNFQNYLTYIIC